MFLAGILEPLIGNSSKHAFFSAEFFVMTQNVFQGHVN